MKNFYKIVRWCIATALTFFGIVNADNLIDFGKGFVAAIWILWVIVEFSSRR